MLPISKNSIHRIRLFIIMIIMYSNFNTVLIDSTLCNLPLNEGVQCHVSSSSRFWYNASSTTCQAFLYKGCQGNSNSFLSIDSCYRSCNGVQGETLLDFPPYSLGLFSRGPLSAWRSSKGREREEDKCPRNYECYFDGATYGCCPTAGTWRRLISV
ncbi:unnamed protein product [Haemonchus placei]|uniref:BPTI/Kunitz inhibitor domain-containing protein n=1 Tax=Haemonchus placei TaxID=6290 RepID=A0A0N4VZP9_HAEPC|nr:unnamed protein product [Haemonchus placei]